MDCDNASMDVVMDVIPKGGLLEVSNQVSSIVDDDVSDSAEDLKTKWSESTTEMAQSVVSLPIEQLWTLEQELAEARQEARIASEALSNLSKGIGALTRLMQRPLPLKAQISSPPVEKEEACVDEVQPSHDKLPTATGSSDDNLKGSKASSCTEIDYFNQDERILSDILNSKLVGTPGSDLLAFVNAAHMIREHARLASEEASLLVGQDVPRLQRAAEEANARAALSEAATKKSNQENVVLKKYVRKLRRERRALVTEVKSLRDEIQYTRKFDSWRNLEEHILRAIQIHEKVLTGGIPNKQESESKQVQGNTNENCDDNQRKKSPEKDWDMEDFEKDAKNSCSSQPSNDTSPVPEKSVQVSKDSSSNNQLTKSRNRGIGGILGLGGGFGRSQRVRETTDLPDLCSKAESSNDKEESGEPKNCSGQQMDTSEASGYVPVKFSGSVETPLASAGQDDQGKFKFKSFFSPGTPSTVGSIPKSPLINIDDATVCLTDDSMSEERSPQMSNMKSERERCNSDSIIMPRNVSFDTERENNPPSNLPTPNFTPEISPDGVGTPELKPICDPKILRTLAIPTDNDDDDDDCDDRGKVPLPSPRVCVGPGLYEC